MNKTEQKREILTKQPNCVTCGCKMVVSSGPTRGKFSHEAVLRPDEILICFQCHQLMVKARALAERPFWSRFWIKFDRWIGIPRVLRLIRVRWNQFVYFKIKGGKATGKYPEWLKKRA